MKSCLQEENIQPNNATLVTTNGCPHENNILTKEIRWAIQTIIALITCQWNSVQQPVVLYCCNIQNPHICFTDGFLCLSCVYLVCREESHVSEHYKFSSHSVYFDMSFMKIYCCRCKAYLADHLSSYIISKLDWSMRMAQGEERTGGFQLSSLPPSMKRNLEWIPSPQELEWIKAYSVSVDSEESKVFPYPGLCGLLNLGNSCYMNAILQVMLHTVPLKRYFLSDTHRCHCPRNIQQCAACALDDLLIKGYHESLERDLSEREPLSPQYILEIIWRHCDSLASYAQHDAHEFFITFVNVLRQHMMTGMNKEEPTPYSRDMLSKQPNKEEEKEERGGWLDDLFSGVLESHVYCASCKRYSATLEDYFDISLDLNSSEDSDGTRTLQECLTWFTSPEELDNGTSRYCEYCQQHTSFYKRVAFHKLPQVLCFHLKRFQHGLDGKGVSSKVESEIGFPIHGLDMSPYISSQILEETRVVEETLEDGIATKKPPQDDDEEQQRVSKENMLYDLYAVVNHIGKIDHGHYITWIREQNSSWFKCDDEVVEESLWTKDNVAQSCQAYLLFYIARNVA